MRVGMLTGVPVEPTRSASQARVGSLLHALLEQDHEVWHGHAEPTGYDHAPFLRGLAAIYPDFHLVGHAHHLPTDLGVLILSDLWLEPALQTALSLARPRRDAGVPIVFDSMDCLSATVAGSWPADRLAGLASLEAQVRALSHLSVFVSANEVLKAERLDPAFCRANALVLPTCHRASRPTPPFTQRQHIAFIGSDAAHNLSAVRFFVQRVWPA